MPTTITDSISAISGLTLRLRADQVTGVANGSTVATWPDASGSGFDATQATTTNQPVYTTSAIGGQPGITFSSGTTKSMVSSAPAGTATQTLIAVLSWQSAAGTATIRGASTNDGLEWRLLSGKQNFVAQQVADLGSSTTALTSGVAAMIAATHDASSGSAWYLNGTADGSSTNHTSLVASTSTIGVVPSGGEVFLGTIAELLVWGRVLTAGELSTVGSYVQSRYGITVAGGASALTNTVAPAITPTSSVTTGTVLTTTNGTWSATPDSYTYQWNRAGVAISGATASTYTVVSADAGQAITCTVTAVKATYTSGTATSNTVTPAAATTTITATDAGFIYSPYNWNVASGVATTINPGAYVRATFTGATGVTLNFDMTNVSTPVPKLKVRVDDGPWVVYDCAATITPTMPATNTWTVHHVELVVQSTSEFLNRWTPQNAVVKFTGFTLNATGAALRTAVPLGKNVLIYGDSITEGYKTLLNVTTPDGSDATVAWSSLQRAQLGVEVGVVGFGAQGWLSGGQGGVPALPSSYNLLYSGVSRSFTLAPDLIVINMGQNDSSDITSVTTTFLNTLLALNTTTKIALMLPFSGAHAAQLQAAQAACATPSRVTYIDTTGWWNSADSFDGVHPEGVASQSSLAPRLANALRPLLAGTVTPKRYVNVGGTAKAIA